MYLALIQKYSYHTYGSVFIMGYGFSNPVYVRLVNNVWKEQEQLITNSDLPIYTTLNGVTKIKNLPFGIYNISTSEVVTLTDKPSELAGGRCIIITSGFASSDEKVALILASHYGTGGIYFGYIYGTSVSEFSWKTIVRNNS